MKFPQWIHLFYLHINFVWLSRTQTTFKRVASGCRLTDYVIYEGDVSSLNECVLMCASQESYCTCRSINFQKIGNSRHKCILNNATMPHELISNYTDPEYDYYEVTEFIDGSCGVVYNQHVSGESCADLRKKGYDKDGVYEIKIGTEKVLVRCDMTTDGGGWTVFQRRVDGSVYFYRDWQQYKAGFGDPRGEFWLGLDHIYNLTRNSRNLRIDLERFNGEKRYAEYSTFYIENEIDNYRIKISGFSGNGGDSLVYHANNIFTTKDHNYGGTCAKDCQGAWWYKRCHNSNLNGLWGVHEHGKGIIWFHWTGHNQSLKKSEMKVRPSNF